MSLDFKKALNHITDDAAVCEKYAEHLTELFAVVDAEKISAELAAATERGDAVGAVRELAKYYRSRPKFTIAELSSVGEYDLDEAEGTVRGDARVVNIDWHFEGGEMQFLFNPTELHPPVNHEWLWQFNRHKYWANLSRAYTATGDERYAAAFKRQLLRWIAETYIPDVWNAPGSAWRTIECGIRLLAHWQVTYDGFSRSETVDDATLLLMIASMHRQASHLVAHPTKCNWLMMEMNGVYTFSGLFYELSDSERNRKFASDLFIKELESQIMSDGFQNELSPDYEFVVYNCAYNFYNMARGLGRCGDIPSSFFELLDKAADTMIKMSTPAFTQPRTNDTFTIFTSLFAERAAAIFGDRPEYRYVLTGRKEGAPPVGDTASYLFPNAGFVAMRSDWSGEASYMCFDVGPLGAAHEHQDKLNINLFKGNEELIFDDGGGQYDISAARECAISGYGHNLLLVDGLAQHREWPRVLDRPAEVEWETTASYDYAAASYNDGFGKESRKLASHRREIRFEKPDLFLVTDTVRSTDGKAHDYELLFQLDTTRVKNFDGSRNSVVSDFGKKYDVLMVALDEREDEVILTATSAATEPMMRGWFNGRNAENLHEAITVARKIEGVRDIVFRTLIIPFESAKGLPRVEKTADSVSVSVGGRDYFLKIKH